MSGAERALTEARRDREFWGRLVESAVVAHLVNAAAAGLCQVFYWRERNHEVDFVVKPGKQVTAIEVKSGRSRDSFPGLAVFVRANPKARTLLVAGRVGPTQPIRGSGSPATAKLKTPKSTKRLTQDRAGSHYTSV